VAECVAVAFFCKESECFRVFPAAKYLYTLDIVAEKLFRKIFALVKAFFHDLLVLFECMDPDFHGVSQLKHDLSKLRILIDLHPEFIQELACVF